MSIVYNVLHPLVTPASEKPTGVDLFVICLYQSTLIYNSLIDFSCRRKQN